MVFRTFPHRAGIGSGTENTPSAERVNSSREKKYVEPSAPVKADRSGADAVPSGTPGHSRARGRGYDQAPEVALCWTYCVAPRNSVFSRSNSTATGNGSAPRYSGGTPQKSGPATCG